MGIEFDGRMIETDKNGYLVNFDDWSEGLAEVIASEEEITLTSEHWDVIRYMRDKFVNHAGEQPNTRTIAKDMSEVWTDKKVDASYLYKLFPRDPSKQGGRISGLPESRRKGGY